MNYFGSSWSSTFICITISLTVGSALVTEVVDISKAAENDEVGLNCTSSDESRNFVWNYTSSITGEVEKLQTINNTHLISSSSMTGVYLCAFGNTAVRQFQAYNFSEPYIPRTGKSIILTEASVDQTLQCFSYSYPPVSLVWTVTYPESSNPINLSASNSNAFTITTDGKSSSSLTISKVSFGDRGTYNCTATSANLNITSKTSVFVRVHQRLAPLWPFLGILCEVLIVSCIVIIVRRKSTSAEKELGRPFQDSNCSESSQDADNLTVRFRGGGSSRS